MIIPLGGDVYVNAAHISLLSGVQSVDNRPNAYQVRLVLMGNKEHIVVGTQENIRELHGQIKAALEELDS